jgi:hypothetical protein
MPPCGLMECGGDVTSITVGKETVVDNGLVQAEATLQRQRGLVPPNGAAFTDRKFERHVLVPRLAKPLSGRTRVSWSRIGFQFAYL